MQHNMQAVDPDCLNFWKNLHTGQVWALTFAYGPDLSEVCIVPVAGRCSECGMYYDVFKVGFGVPGRDCDIMPPWDEWRQHWRIVKPTDHITQHNMRFHGKDF